MAFVYRCDVTYLAMNDNLTKHLNIYFASETRVPESFVANAVLQQAYGQILRLNIGSPRPGSKQADLELSVEECEEREV